MVAKLKKEVLYKNMTAEQKTTKADKIVQSRYVLTEKGIEAEDIEKAESEGVLISRDGDASKKAKARHVMKGFSEENSEYLEVTMPQVGKETVLFTLQILASLAWSPGYLDFTQRSIRAIHSSGRSMLNSRAKVFLDAILVNFYDFGNAAMDFWMDHFNGLAMYRGF